MVSQRWKRKARISLLPLFRKKRRSSFELSALKELSKISPQWDRLHMNMYLYICIYTYGPMHLCKPLALAAVLYWLPPIYIYIYIQTYIHMKIHN